MQTPNQINNNNAHYVQTNPQIINQQMNPNQQNLVQMQNQNQNQTMVKLPKNKKNLKKDLSIIKEEDSMIAQSGFEKKMSLQVDNEIKEENEEKKENEIIEEKKEEEKKENEMDIPIQEKIPEKTFSKDIENDEMKKNKPVIQSVGPDFIDNLPKLPTFEDILKGQADLLPIIKRKKY